jgi:hypothetical protein
MRRSLVYVGGSVALMALSTMFWNDKARAFVLGQDFRGGEYLTLTSGSSNHDYYYNREFQRMMYLSENVAVDSDGGISDRHLANLGG